MNTEVGTIKLLSYTGCDNRLPLEGTYLLHILLSYFKTKYLFLLQYEVCSNMCMSMYFLFIHTITFE